MTGWRGARIGGIAAAFLFLIRMSRLATHARASGEVPSVVIPLAVISFLLLVSAVVGEKVRTPGTDLQKDGFWGLALGGLVAVGFMLFY